MMRVIFALALLLSANASSFHYEEQDSWGELPDTQCGGNSQSPVNLFTGMGGGNGNFLQNTPYDQSEMLDSFTVPEESVITGFHALTQVVGQAVEGSWSNNGHTLKFTPAEGVNAGSVASRGPMRIWGDEPAFQLAQINFHSPAEHTVNGKQYPLEMQMVHTHVDDASRIAIVSVFFDDAGTGEPNNALSLLLNQVPNVGDDRPIQSLDLTDLQQQGAFYTYTGSLTTPPCTEGVSWIVFRNPKSMSTPQLTKFNKYYRANNRDVQSLNGRVAILNGKSNFVAKFPELDCQYDNTLPGCPGFDEN